MKVLLDTNIILDLWLAREPYWLDAANLIAAIERKEHLGLLCPTTLTTLHYLAKKGLGDKKARKLIGDLLRLCEVGNLNRETLEKALESGISDFEDAVLEAAAIQAGADFIATRNLRDFRKSRIPAGAPRDLL